MPSTNVLRGAAGLVAVLISAHAMAAQPEEELVCRYQPRPGSRILLHTCLTEAQWAALDKRQAAARSPLLLGPSGSQGGAWDAAAPGTVTPVSIDQNRY
jgi:hypothetical protein